MMARIIRQHKLSHVKYFMQIKVLSHKNELEIKNLKQMNCQTHLCVLGMLSSMGLMKCKQQGVCPH